MIGPIIIGKKGNSNMTTPHVSWLFIKKKIGILQSFDANLSKRKRNVSNNVIAVGILY